MAQISSAFQVYDKAKKNVVARIALNGYDISAGDQHGAIRSFKVLQGDLWEQWNQSAPLVLQINETLDTPIRVAALPVDEESFGLIEFL
jgi:hypothetical protein